MKQQSMLLMLWLLSLDPVLAESARFNLTITNDKIDLNKSLELRDVADGSSEIKFEFQDSDGRLYHFMLDYVPLPSNRSYPTNLDITLSDTNGEKLGYLFWANNGIASLKSTGTFGFVVDIEGLPTDIQFNFDKTSKGALRVADLIEERFVQDTLIPKYGFQMIRPVILMPGETGELSQSYRLDDHPFEVNYTLRDIESGFVEFQFNLYRINEGNRKLLERIYYHADSLSTLRDGMFAGKYYDQDAGTIKLVYYPTMGQTTPPAQ